MSTPSPIDRAVRIAGSQTLLGERIGRSQNWVSRVSSGKIASISVDDAFAIERATGGAVKAAEFAGIAPGDAPAGVEGASGCDADAPARSASDGSAGGRAA